MERNIGGVFLYKANGVYSVHDCRSVPFTKWGELPRQFNMWQSIGQLKIFFLAKGIRPWQARRNSSSFGA